MLKRLSLMALLGIATVGVPCQLAAKSVKVASLRQGVSAKVVLGEPKLMLQVRSLVEQHLEDGEYGVEQLAHDLCMERTGLYKKLTTLTDTTPVAFIRSVRLRRAAALLQEGTLTVNEIAERTGFSSPSYFTKCFKKEFGVLPSEYM